MNKYEDKEEQKRTYNIKEIFEFEEGTEFIAFLTCRIYRVKIDNNDGILNIYNKGNGEWIEALITKDWANAKFLRKENK